MKSPHIINIQKFSVHDGSGIRTTVFFKGCPLKCWWCHNPESQRYDKEVLFDAEKCTGCGYCKKGCEYGAITVGEKAVTDFSRCVLCGECTDYCLQNNREIVGTQYSIEDLMKILLQDKVFYDQSGGGVTLSGGEVMTQDMDYIEELCRRIKKEGIHLAIDTCGYGVRENFERIVPYADVFLFDIKALDSKIHEKYTGVPNDLILSNLEYLLYQKANVNIRIPVIQSVNDDEKSILDLIDYIKNHAGNVEINLLPYHNTGSSKYDKLGRTYPAKDFLVPPKEKMDHIKELFEKSGFTKVKIGG